MLIVENDVRAVERDLAEGRLRCPSCGDGSLRRWWFARRRVLRDGQSFRPRRGRCDVCRATHVLLPDACLLRRRDAAEVIGAAITAVAAGAEHHDAVASRLGVPRETLRGWLRRFRRCADEIAAHFTSWFVALAPGLELPRSLGPLERDALEAIGATSRAASLRLGRPRLPWCWASALSSGKLLVPNTSSTWPRQA